MAGERHHFILNQLIGLSWQTYPGVFSGYISGTNLVATDRKSTTVLKAGQVLTGTGIAADTMIVSGERNNWVVNISQTAGSVSHPISITASPATLGPTDEDPTMTVRSVEVLRPAPDALDLVPPVPPLPAIAWESDYANRTWSSGLTAGTKVATLSGCASYAVLGYPGLAVSGSDLVTAGTQVAGSYPEVYIEGTDAEGTPAIIPRFSITVLS